MNIVLRLAGLLPPNVLNRIGRLQYSNPYLRPFLQRLSQPLRSGEATIRFGVGKGMRFDPSGGNPGYALGSVSMAEQDALAKHLRLGDVFFDIGANVGFFAVIAAKLVGPKGKVYAFEPFAKSAEAIRGNAKRNGLDSVTVLQCAISSESRTGVLSLVGDSATFSLTSSDGAPAPETTTSVSIRVIDDLIKEKQVEPPNLVLIDVEGAELGVLQGMRKTIEDYAPVIICEVHGLGKQFIEQVANVLTPHGYRASQLDGSALPEDASRYHAIMWPPSRQDAYAIPNR